MNDVVLVFLLLTLNIFTPFSTVSIVDFEQVNFSWILTGNIDWILMGILTINGLNIAFMNPFHSTGLFFYPPKNIRKPEVF